MLSRRSLIRAGAGVGAAAALTAGTGGLVVAQAAAVIPWNTLQSRLTGRLVLPSDAAYDTAKQLQLAQFDAIHPQAIAYCTSEADVAACIRFAQDYELAPAVRSGGHSQAGYSTTPGLVIDVSQLNSVRPGDTVHLGPGSQGVDVLNTLAPYGIQVASGTCATVAVGGWLQGGGLGFAARKFGMGADRLVSARVVLANGRTVRASQDEHPDLYWALRGGGGGNFGVVTDFEVRPVQIPTLTTYNLNFGWADAVQVILAWQDWIATAPRELSSELLFLLSTDAPAGTEPYVVLTGGYAGPKADCDRVLDQLVAAVGRPSATREVVERPYQQAMMNVFGCGTKTVTECHRVGYSPDAQLPRDNYSTGRNMFFSQGWTRTAAEEALGAFTADARPGQFRFMGLFAYAGKINDVAPTATAFVHRDTLFNAGYTVGLTRPDLSQDDKDRGQAWVDNGFTTMDPYSMHRSYQNYMDPALTNWRQAYYGQNYTRLRTVKRAYDPNRFFRFAQGIG
ncbi:FAD-binding oxidoreductase [Streptomyces sp. H34-S4]|uniref:FAD-binding oxidoreductase n=1 Tax=Streptomyces sp. H34-S4 TaxID=2996463 RepID=UPI00227032C9|nr:FAD-binding protein [Streptomyces sp. H34-S4]MCY0936750.1 FAD-binding protein [Streptomyces sp. H34-S4]